MRDFEDSTLWQISQFERVRWETGSSGFQRLDGGPTLLSTTLVTDLRRLEAKELGDDPLEITVPWEEKSSDKGTEPK